MGLIEVKKDFSHKELQWFGPLFALFMAIICVVLWRSGVSPDVILYVAYASGAVIVVYYLVPRLRRPLYRGWIYSVIPIGWLVSHLLLIIIYYLLFTPVGLVMRLVGYDPMRRKLEENRDTYWVTRQNDHDPQRYFKQY